MRSLGPQVIRGMGALLCSRTLLKGSSLSVSVAAHHKSEPQLKLPPRPPASEPGSRTLKILDAKSRCVLGQDLPRPDGGRQGNLVEASSCTHVGCEGLAERRERRGRTFLAQYMRMKPCILPVCTCGRPPPPPLHPAPIPASHQNIHLSHPCTHAHI